MEQNRRYASHGAGAGAQAHWGRGPAEGGTLHWEAALLTPACAYLVGHLVKTHADAVHSLRCAQYRSKRGLSPAPAASFCGPRTSLRGCSVAPGAVEQLVSGMNGRTAALNRLVVDGAVSFDPLSHCALEQGEEAEAAAEPSCAAAMCVAPMGGGFDHSVGGSHPSHVRHQRLGPVPLQLGRRAGGRSRGSRRPTALVQCGG